MASRQVVIIGTLIMDDPAYPNQGLPGLPHYPSNALPGVPVYPNQGLPGQPVYPNQGLPVPPNYPSQGLPVPPGYPSQGLPPFPSQGLPGGGGYPSHPIYYPPVYPDHSLPGGQGGGATHPIAGTPGPSGLLTWFYSPTYGWIAQLTDPIGPPTGDRPDNTLPTPEPKE